MLDAAIKALTQILSPPMRSILWRSIGLALVLITVLAIGLQRLLSWFATYGEDWAEALLGPGFHTPLNVLAWVVSIAAGLGVVLGGIFLMPAITSLVASVFVDDVADHVELEHYPAERPGVALPLGVAMREGIKTALLTVLVYLIALPFVFVAGAGLLVFFIATAWLLGREYFELAAMRFRSPAGGFGRTDGGAVYDAPGAPIRPSQLVLDRPARRLACARRRQPATRCLDCPRGGFSGAGSRNQS